MHETNYNTIESPFLKEGISEEEKMQQRPHRGKNVFLFIATFLLGALVADLHASGRTSSNFSSETMVGAPTGTQQIGQFVQDLAAKLPTPGGGAAAAISASIGAAAAVMSAAYTSRKKDIASGNAEFATKLTASIDLNELISLADEDAVAYAALQRTWKEKDMTAEEKAQIEAAALAVPVKLTTLCHKHISAIRDFLPKCNEKITSDAKVGIHGLAGAARAAYQTALVNEPGDETKKQLNAMLADIQQWESEILTISPSSASASTSAGANIEPSIQAQAPAAPNVAGLSIADQTKPEGPKSANF